MKTQSFAHEIGESALAGVGRNNMWISSIWNGFGKSWKHQVLQTKLENLHWQGWAGIIYVNIFYLKWLWEGMKTPSFAHEIGESALAGVGRNNICEYLLFEMALGSHENTKFCTQELENIFYLKWLCKALKHQGTEIGNLPWQGWAGIIYVKIFYLKWLWKHQGMRGG